MTLADPQFSRRPLGNNAPSKGLPPLIFLFSWLRWSACGVRARQLRCVAGAVQQGKRETGNGTRSRRRSVSASEKGQRGKSEGLKKSVHEIASDRGLVGKRRNQREPWSARLRDRRRDDVERQQHGAWGRRRGRERRGSSHTLHRPPLLFWAPPPPLHTPSFSTRAAQQPTGGGRRWGFLLAAVDSFCGRRSLSNLTIGTGPSKRNHHAVDQRRESRHGAAVFRIPSMDWIRWRPISVFFFVLLSPDFQRPGCCCC